MYQIYNESVNAMSNAINYKTRPLRQEETFLLREFLYEAIFIPKGIETPSKEVINAPELKLYIENFGTKKDDFCLVADCAGKVIGAVWVRIMNDYGHIDNQTPSLSISLYKEYRNKGIGSHLMNEMLASLKDKGYNRVSLSVQKANYAVNMYLKLGFKIIKETLEEFLMVNELNKKMSNYQHFLSGEYCNYLDAEVLVMINRTKGYLSVLNDIKTAENEKKEILSKMLGNIGNHSSVGQNFTCQCGKHIFIGEQTIINKNCTMMDENQIHIGDRVLVAPNVQFYTATHPINFDERFVENWNEDSGELFFRTKALPITVEDNAWIGGGSIILAGVTIGKGSVIGAGSVVTKSIPENCLAAGNPCKVIKWLSPQYRLLPLEEKDIPEMQELFRSTVLNVNIRHYTQEEVEDWASCGDSVEHLKELLSHNHFIGAFDEAGRMVGFSSMNKDGYLHSMFVHKDWQGKGVATQLLSEVERIAKQLEVAEITSEVSLTARPFFEKKGYEIVKIQKYRANKLELTNFVMRKLL